MTDSSAVAGFCAESLTTRYADLPSALPCYDAFTCGSQPESAPRLAHLVLSGVKTATSGLMRHYEDSDRPRSQPQDSRIVTDGAGEPVCVIETLETAPIPCDQVDASIAYDYGEEDRTLEWWRENLWEFYVEECEENG